MKNYYKVLGLPDFASLSQIKSAYRKLALQYHPDRNPNDANATYMLQMVNEAYMVLKDRMKRFVLDAELRQHIFVPKEDIPTPHVPHPQAAPQNPVFIYRRYKFWDLNRILSLSLVIFYNVTALFFNGDSILIYLGLYSLVVCTYIWFGDEIGSFTGGGFSRETPGCFVRAFGWILLLMPILVFVCYIILYHH